MNLYCYIGSINQYRAKWCQGLKNALFSEDLITGKSNCLLCFLNELGTACDYTELYFYKYCNVRALVLKL